ncbi:hypothetical protein E4T56_gene4655, partial [Termitomyces sp. T112]
MTYNFISCIFCFCSHEEEEENFNIPAELDDETTRLIPDSLEPSMCSDPTLTNYYRIRLKLENIVRAKERKMVNVGSQIPFNLHNQVPAPKVDHSLSRFFDHLDSAGGCGEGIYYGQQPYPPTPYPHFTIKGSPDPYSDRSRSRSKSMERQPPAPILNVRLVDFVNRRGRTMRRNHSDIAVDSMASDSTPTAPTLGDFTGGSSPSTT